MSKIALIINTASGTNDEKLKELKRLLLEKSFLDIELIELNIKTINETIVDLTRKGFESIVACGGDGTVSLIAGVIITQGLNVKLGVLPFGTFNHFAHDIHMPEKIEDALDILRKGNSAFVDVGKVNTTYFVNNSSLGLYPKIVKYREEYQKKGWHKNLALVGAIFSLVASRTALYIEFAGQNTRTLRRKTSFVFIGNNKYKIEGFTIGERDNIDQGLLSVYVARNVNWIRILILGFHALTGTLLKQEDFNTIGLQTCTISMRKKTVLVSHDGEISQMNTPLTYQIHPKVLRVIIP